ncbi:MAG TPA: formyltransferase family protein [Candidatus Saccharimonadales bacterium]|jgi:phosphoribosylglycinamide formyltransferase-1|nr:formyltransferase family protein [Candidatus Saccharimonadales bacterium]
MKPRVAILASGGGTTAEAFIRANQRGEISVDVGLVIVSRQDAGIFERIANLNREFGLSIETVLINSKTHPSQGDEVEVKGRQTVAEEQAILETLTNGNFDLIAHMGYMKLVGPRVVKAFGWQPEYTSIFQAMEVNTHPGLLPDTAAMYGEKIQSYVLDQHLPYGGQTLHIVAEAYDDGPIIAEHRVPVEPDDTADSLFARVQAVEKQYLPKDIADFIKARHAYLAANK